MMSLQKIIYLSEWIWRKPCTFGLPKYFTKPTYTIYRILRCVIHVLPKKIRKKVTSKKNAKNILKAPKTSRHLPIHHCPTCNMAARPLCRSATDQRRCAPVRSMAAFCAAEAASCWAKPFRPGRKGKKPVTKMGEFMWPPNWCGSIHAVKILEILRNFQKNDGFFLDTWGGFEAFLAFLVSNERTTLVPTTQKFLKKSDPSHVAAPFCCLTIAAQRVRIASDQGIQLGESAARNCDLLLRHWRLTRLTASVLGCEKFQIPNKGQVFDCLTPYHWLMLQHTFCLPAEWQV